jgi:hypothetical protein
MSITNRDFSEDLNKRSISEVGRSTPLGTPTRRTSAGMRRRTELGFLLFLQYQAKLSPGQWAYLLGLQRKSTSEEIDSAIGLFRALLASQRSQARARKDLEKVLSSTPSLSPKSVRREQRRIGVGYRDKGTLRLPHQDHQVQPRSWWWEDIAPILHLSPIEVISRDLLAEEDLAIGDILYKGEKTGGVVSFLTKSKSVISICKWRFPSTTLQPEEILERISRGF